MQSSVRGQGRPQSGREGCGQWSPARSDGILLRHREGQKHGKTTESRVLEGGKACGSLDIIIATSHLHCFEFTAPPNLGLSLVLSYSSSPPYIVVIYNLAEILINLTAIWLSQLLNTTQGESRGRTSLDSFSTRPQHLSLPFTSYPQISTYLAQCRCLYTCT